MPGSNHRVVVAWSAWGVVMVAAVAALVAIVSAIALALKFRRAGRRSAVLLRAHAMRIDQLERDNAQLKSANEALEAFTFVVSHDLKEPVRTTEMLLSFLEEDHAASLPEDARDLIERSRRSTRQLSTLVGSLLDLSRASRIAHEDLAPVDIVTVLGSEACQVRYEEIIRAHRASMEVRVEQGTLVRATPAAVAQIFGNLVANAVQHNRASPPRVVVRKEDARRDGFVSFSIEDDGPGFPPELLARFDSGDALAGGQHFGGFGLLIARRAVARLGGVLTIGASTELGGAAVRFDLPLPERSHAMVDARERARRLAVLGTV